MNKICTVCKLEKPISEFHKRTHRTSIGTSSRCKPCDKAKTYAWRKLNPERTREIVMEYYARSKEEKREDRAAQKRGHKARRRETDPTYVANVRMGDQMRQFLKGVKNGRSWAKIVGYSADDLRRHLERQFVQGMSWANRSEWEVDHIVPLASFPPMEPGDRNFCAAWAMANLRPIWREQNRKKWAHRELLV